MSTGLTISIMKSAKSLTSALHSFSLLSSLLFLTLFGSSAHFAFLHFLHPPLNHPLPKRTHLSLLLLLFQLTSLASILHFSQSFFGPFYTSVSTSLLSCIFNFLIPLSPHSAPSPLLFFSHCCFGLISL